MTEFDFYPIMRKWLEKEGFYCGGNITDNKGDTIFYENKGTLKSRIDVAGVKNIGIMYFDDIHVAAVEVRNRPVIKFRDIQDTVLFSQYAHLCYLATTGDMNEKIIENAQQCGVGLLDLSNGKVEEVLSPVAQTPVKKMMMEFLNSINISQCAICGAYFELYRRSEDGVYSYLTLRRPRYFKVCKKDKDSSPLESLEYRELGNDYRTYSYICRMCVKELFPHRKGKVEDE
jgi:hypothetical protein